MGLISDSIIVNFRWAHYGPGVDAAYNGNDYHKYFLGVKAADV